jgi:RNA polymerase-binding protein DksA
MDKAKIESLAQLLRTQRQHFLEEFRRAEEDLGFIAEERESELEERAQEERAAKLLASLDDRTLFAVREIDAAFKRIHDGLYGRCEACGKQIPIARLRVLPAARFCKNCAGHNEIRTFTSSVQDARTRPQSSNRVARVDEIQWAQAAGEQPLDESDRDSDEAHDVS